MDLSQSIKKLKPNLKNVSISRYVSNINKLMKDLDIELKDLNDTEKIMKFLEDKSASTKKTYLNSLIVTLQAIGKEDGIDEYKKARDKLNEDYFNNANKKTTKEENNMLDEGELNKLIEKLQKEINDKKLYSKNNLSKSEYNIILFELLLKLYNNYPFRLDYAIMKVITPSQYKKNNNMDYNYYVNGAKKSYFVLNNYKTNGTYGSKKIDIDPAIRKYINKFLKNISRDPSILITDFKGIQFTRNRLGKFLTNQFIRHINKKISAGMIRKSYLTNKYSDIKDEMQKDSNIMGHSTNTQQNIYVKDI